MGSAESSQYIKQYPGMSLPTDNRLPWNPWSAEPFQDISTNGDRLPWNRWSEDVFQETRNNRNKLPWNPWSEETFKENRDSENKFLGNPWSEEAVQETGNNENKLPWNPCCTETFQDTRNGEDLQSRNPWSRAVCENRYNGNGHYFSRKNANFSRKNNRRNRKRNRSRNVLHNTRNNNTVISSHEMRQLGQQGWNHEPVMDWTKINVPSRPIKTNFHHLSRLNSSNEHYKIPHRSRTFTRSKFINTSPNNSSSTLEASVSRANANLKSYNLSKTFSGNGETNAQNHRNSRKLSEDMSKKDKKSVNSTFSKSCNEEDDIEYMFSVDPSSEGQLVLEVDLQSDVVDLISNKNSSGTVNAAKKYQVEDAAAEEPIIILGKSETTVSSKSRKRKLFSNDTAANKKPTYQPRCAACDISYGGVTEKNENMYMSSSCRHIFCGSCISKDGKPKVCPVCKNKFLNFRRLYL